MNAGELLANSLSAGKVYFVPLAVPPFRISLSPHTTLLPSSAQFQFQFSPSSLPLLDQATRENATQKLEQASRENYVRRTVLFSHIPPLPFH